MLCLVVFGMMAFSADKKLHFELNERQANRMFNDLTVVQQIVDGSTIPHVQAKAIIASIDSIKADLGPQYLKQIDTTGKK